MFAWWRQFWRDYREFNKSLRALARHMPKPMPACDVYALAAVAAEIGVGVQEAKDGTWRQRFEVVDDPPLQRIGEQDCD